MRGGVFVMAVGACGFSPHAAGVAHDDAGSSDADAFVPQDVADAPPGQMCFGSLASDRICYRLENLPAGPRTYMVAETINTDSGVCDPNAILPPGNPCVIAAGTITLSGIAALHVIGARPLVLVATEPGGIVISAGTLLDASSVFTQIGAGTYPATSCTGSVDATAKAGGFGGTFLALGGTGGDGQGDTGHGTPATAIQLPLAQLHGGCPGGSGGGNNGTAAPGGGALALVATTITVDGLIAAGGAGGHTSSTNNHGGNGGGAGGLVVLDSVALAGGGEVDAKGGGGGEGTGGLAGVDGTAGYNFPNRAAESLGGSGDTSGGDGGRGGPQTDLTASGAGGGSGSGGGGGGGGGGAAGVILVTATGISAITFEPAPQ